MKRIRKNLVRIEAMLIAVIMTVSMFANVGVNAAEIINDNIISKIADESVGEVELSGDETEAETNVESSNVEISAESESNDEEFEEEIEIIETDEASEITMMHVDESEYLLQSGGFAILDEALGANVAGAQDAIYNGLKAQSDEIDLRGYGILQDDFGTVFRGTIDAHPDLYYVDTSDFNIYIDPWTSEVTYILPVYSNEYDILAFDRAAEKAMSVVKTDMNDLERAIALHDYLALNVEYNKAVADGAEAPAGSPVFSAYGALVNQDAVCQGYALAYEYLLSLADVECGLVTSDAICHAWNYVKIDGQYYNVDVTWDDPSYNGFVDIVGLVTHNNMFKSDRNFNRSPVDEYDHTHQADDWVISINGTTTTTGFANDTFYDNFYWGDVFGQFVWGDDGEVFYEYRDMIGNKINGRSIKKGSIDGTQSEVFLSLSVESAEAFGLYRIGDTLYYNSGLDIVGVKINDKSQKTPLNIPIVVTGAAICYNVESDSFEVKYQSGTECYVLSIAEISGIEEYNVLFLDENENVIAVRKVLKGEKAEAPELPNKKGYTAEWDKSFTNVQTDIDVKAVYTLIDYNITYNLVKTGATNNVDNPATYNVVSAFLFKEPSLEGYEFAGWYQDAEYKTVPRDKIEKGTTEDIVLFAKWIPKKPEAPVIKAEQALVLENGDILVDADTEITIESEAGTKIYYTVDGSNPTKASKVYNGGFVVNERTVVKAIAVRETAESPVSSKIFVIANNDFKLQDDVSLKVGESSQISAVTLPTTKQFSDIVSFSSSDINVATVSDSGVITAVGEGTATITATITDWRGRNVQDTLEVEVGAQTYYVTFVGYDNNVIETQPVLGGRNAVAPDMSIEGRTPKGYNFISWDKAFNEINEDTIVYARFETQSYYIYFINAEGPNPSFRIYDIVSEDMELPNSSEVSSYNDRLVFAGWYDNEAYTGSPISKIPSGSTGDMVFYAKWMVEATLTMEWNLDNDYLRDVSGEKVAFLPYTGKAQTPAFTVYYGDTKLENKKDYTYKFVNNVNANYSDVNNRSEMDLAKTPTLIITGKGNYAGTEKVYFNIVKKDISDSDVDIVPVSLAYNKKTQKVAPVVTWNGKKLTTKELTFEYDSVKEGAYINPGAYNVMVSGKGNFEGVKPVSLEIFNTAANEADASVLIKSCKVSIAPFDYTDEGLTKADIINHVKVTYGKNNTVPYYEDDVDENGYDIELAGGTVAKNIGTYTVRIWGKGIYKGEIRTTFKINGLNVSTMKVAPILAQIYDGTAKEPELTITSKTGERLVKDTHYTLDYQKNVDVGTATVVITGINSYFGSRKVSFKINQKVMAVDSADWNDISISLLGYKAVEGHEYGCYEYTKGGVTPKLEVKYAGKTLQEKVDYTLAYKNNNTATPVAGKEPYIVLTLKKNIKGTKNIRFDIIHKDLDDKEIIIKVNDVQESTQPGKYKSTPAMYDVNGKKLDSKDYDIEYTYEGSTTPLDKYSKPEAGKVIEVTVKGKGNYIGSKKATYRVYAKGKSVASASIKIKPEVLKNLEYSGQPVVLEEENLEVKLGKTTVLVANKDYVIDATSYVNNTNKGTAKVTIIGKGDYAGSKTISFSIKPWYLKWWIF